MQITRPITISTPLKDDMLLFRSMKGKEELGRLFEFNLELLSEDHQIKLDSILGKNMTVQMELPDEKTRYFNGIVSRFTYTGQWKNYARYQAAVHPWFWLLTRTADCRIFQNKTVPDIIKDVFRQHGFSDFEESLSGSYSTLEYCVQYRETAFNFLSRLMEQEGIYYYFKHSDGKHILVLSDSYSSHEIIPGYERVPYYVAEGDTVRDEDHIYNWSVSQEVQTGACCLNDFDFEKPGAGLMAKSNFPRNHPASDYEAYDYPGGYSEVSNGETYVRARMEEIQIQYERMNAKGNGRGLFAGGLFALFNYPRDDQNREYLVVSASHELQSYDYETDSEQKEGTVYLCGLDVIDSKQPYRSPRTTPNSLVRGPQTATVVGPSGEKVWTDKYGRVKVQFHWDREGERNENSSCWVRVSQNWAGKAWGGIYIPHIGQEVIVEFLEGDPSNPIITGRVYNTDNMPPEELPNSKFKSGFRDDYGNELIFDATPGDEHIRLHSPHHNSTIEIGKSIKAETDSKNVTVTKGEAEFIALGATAKCFFGAKAEVFAGLKVDVLFGGNLNVFVGGSVDLVLATKFTASYAGEITLSKGFKFTQSNEKEVVLNDNDYVQHIQGDIIQDSENRCVLIGGPGNSGVLSVGEESGGDNEISISFHKETQALPEFDPKPKMVSATIAGMVGALATAGGVVAAGAGAAFIADSDDKSAQIGGAAGMFTLGTVAGVAGVTSGITAIALIKDIYGAASQKDTNHSSNPDIPHAKILMNELGVHITSGGKSVSMAVFPTPANPVMQSMVGISSAGDIVMNSVSTKKNITIATDTPGKILINSGTGELELQSTNLKLLGSQIQLTGPVNHKQFQIIDPPAPVAPAQPAPARRRGRPRRPLPPRPGH